MLKWNYGDIVFQERFHLSYPYVFRSHRKRQAAYRQTWRRVLVFGNQVIRYAQDDLPAYGNQVWAFEVVRLTPTDYVEKKATNFPIIKANRWKGMERQRHALHQEPQSTGRIADRLRTYRSYLLDDLMDNPALRTSHIELFEHRSSCDPMGSI